MKIYLAGKVPKGDDIEKAIDWRKEFINNFSNYDPPIELLDPEDPQLDESIPLSVFGHDCYLIKKADLVIINASLKLGVGTAQEMLIAKYFSKPVITLLPKNTHHRRENLKMHKGIVKDWIHPFIYSLSDEIFEDISAIKIWVDNNRLKLETLVIKDITIIQKGIDEYLKLHK